MYLYCCEFLASIGHLSIPSWVRVNRLPIHRGNLFPQNLGATDMCRYPPRIFSFRSKQAQLFQLFLRTPSGAEHAEERGGTSCLAVVTLGGKYPDETDSESLISPTFD